MPVVVPVVVPVAVPVALVEVDVLATAEVEVFPAKVEDEGVVMLKDEVLVGA